MAEGLAQLWHHYMGPDFAGFKVYHYERGTTTAKTVWTDSGKTTPAAQPVVASVSGWVSFYADGDYRLDIYDSEDVLLKSLDGVRITQDMPHIWEGSHGSALPAIGSSAEYWRTFAVHSAGNVFDRMKIATPAGWADLISFAGNGIFDVTNYGGTYADGVTIDNVGILAAYAACAAAGGGIVYWPAGSYVLEPEDRDGDGHPVPIVTLGSNNIYTVGYGANVRVQSSAAKTATTWPGEYTYSYAFKAVGKNNIGFWGIEFDGDRNAERGSSVNPRMGLFLGVQCDNVYVRDTRAFDCDASRGVVQANAVDYSSTPLTVVSFKNWWIENNYTDRCLNPMSASEAHEWFHLRGNTYTHCDAADLYSNEEFIYGGSGFSTSMTRGIKWNGFLEVSPAVSGGIHHIFIEGNFVEGAWGVELWNNDPTYGTTTTAAGYFTDVQVTNNILETLWGISTNCMSTVKVSGNTWHRLELNTAAQIEAYRTAGGHVHLMRMALASAPLATTVTTTPATSRITVTLPAVNDVAAGDRIDMAGAVAGSGLSASDLNKQHWILTKPSATQATFVCGTLDTATFKFTTGSVTVTFSGATTLVPGDYITFERWGTTVYEVSTVGVGTMDLTAAPTETTRANVSVLKVIKPNATGNIGGTAVIAYRGGENSYSPGIEAGPMFYSEVSNNLLDARSPVDHPICQGIHTGISHHDFFQARNKIFGNTLQGDMLYGFYLRDCQETEIRGNTVFNCWIPFREELAWTVAAIANTEVDRRKNVFADNTIYGSDEHAENASMIQFADPAPVAEVDVEWLFEGNQFFFKADPGTTTFPVTCSNASAILRFRGNRFEGFKANAIVILAGAILELEGNFYDSKAASPTGCRAVRITRADDMVISAGNETVKNCESYMYFTAGAHTDTYRIGQLEHDGLMVRPFYGATAGDTPAGINFGPAGGIRTKVVECRVAGGATLTVNDEVPGNCWLFGMTAYVYSTIDATTASTLDVGDSVRGDSYWCNDGMSTALASQSDIADFDAAVTGPVRAEGTANLRFARAATNFNSTGIILATIKYLPMAGLAF